MTNLDKLRLAFTTGLGLPPATLVDELEYQGVAEWDSVAHMTLIMEIETTFDLMLPTEDVLDLSSFAQARTIVSRHGVDLAA
jgi:acyl carrier protein